MTIDIEQHEQVEQVEAPERVRNRWTARRLRVPIAFLLALAFFFGPLGAFVLGARPQQIENRELTAFPSLSDGWAFFPQFTAWATDHLPLRAEAVRGNAALSERLFGEAPSYRTDPGGGPTAGVPSGDSTATDTPDSAPDGVPYPQVIEGEDGWLYFGGDVSNLCTATRGVDEVLDRVNRLARAVEESGRTFVVTVAPDKSTVYPDALPETYLGRSCAEERRAEFWDALRDTPPTGYLDLLTGLKAEQERSGVPVYRPTDTHWTPRGAAVYAQELAERLDPALLEGTELRTNGWTTGAGDLGAMIGQPQDDEFEDVTLSRPGVTPVGRDTLDLPEMPYAPETFTARTTGAALFEPSTLLLGDSFSTASRTLLGRFFADLTVLHSQVASEYPQAVADTMVKSDVVVFQIVERTLASGQGALIEEASLTAIEESMAANPR